jgi:hypothetical protein
MDYPYNWYFLALKLKGGTVSWTTFPPGETDKSYADFTYSYTTTPAIKSISNTDILVLSATEPANDEDNATIVLENPTSATVSTNIVLDDYKRPFQNYTTTINSDGTTTVASGDISAGETATLNSVKMDITPSAGTIDVDITTWNTGGNYYKEWEETASAPDITAAHTVGDLEANTYYIVKKDGNTLNPYLSNAGGQITFTCLAGSTFIITKEDSDGDGLTDGWELTYWGNLNQGPNDDPDSDGLNNLGEYNAGTDPTNEDTDGDLMPDDWEVDNSLNPLLDDADEDADSDGWTNLEEYQLGYDPNEATPLKPIGLSPTGDGVSLTPTLTGSAYSDAESDAHLFTEWQIAYDANFSEIIFTDTTSINKRTIDLELGILKPDTTYYWQVRYSDAGGWSPWSDTVEFTTQSSNNFLAGNAGIEVIDTITSNTGTVVQTYRQSSANFSDLPSGYYFYSDIFSFRIEGITPGATVEVTFQLDEVFWSSYKWLKYYPNLGEWDTTYTAHIVSGIGTTQVTLEFKDGGFGDIDGLENGVIVDPGGPAVDGSEEEDEEDEKKDWCFIATAAYGTPMAEEVQTLSQFRDKYLLTNPIGKGFVATYYKVSPNIASFIREYPVLKSIVRNTLHPLIWMSEKSIEE